MTFGEIGYLSLFWWGRLLVRVK